MNVMYERNELLCHRVYKYLPKNFEKGLKHPVVLKDFVLGKHPSFGAY